MKLREPTKWILVIFVVTALVLSVWWGLPFERGWHFYVFRAWAWPGLVLSLIGLCGAALWLFVRHFPAVLSETPFLSPILATVLFVGTFAAVWALALGINELGEQPPPKELIGTITDFKSLKSKAVPSYDREVAVIQVENGPTIEMPIRVLHNLGVNFSFEGKVCLLLHTGNLVYWGWIKSSPCTVWKAP